VIEFNKKYMTNGINSLVKKLPSYATDIKTNLAKIFLINENEFLSQEELYSVALTIGYALRHESVLNSIRSDAKLVLEESNANACKAAAVIMAMNNAFYGFKDLCEDQEINGLESGLDMTLIQNPGIDIKLFEMACLAVSILNKCKYCIGVHQKKLLKKNVRKEVFMEIARIVSVLSAAVVAMDIEKLRSYDFVVREASVDD
jgi:alkyl hydroperoxide reductase subunit D